MTNLRLDQTARKNWAGWSALWRYAERENDEEIESIDRGLFIIYVASPALSAQWIDKSGRSMEIILEEATQYW